MINKTTLIILITLIGILYLIIEGRKEYYNQDNMKNTNSGMLTYLKAGVNSTVNKLCSTVGNMTPKQLTTVSELSNFCLKTIAK